MSEPPQQRAQTLIECGACLAYRSLSPGHPYLIKYTASMAIHTPTTDDEDRPTCTISNLCEQHSPNTLPGVPTTTPGQTCSLGPACSINIPRKKIPKNEIS